MNPWDNRMLDGKKTPDGTSVAEWTGPGYKYWTRLQRFIEVNYPNVFTPDWWFGGKRFGWSLRYKKSKSFCNLVPEKKQTMVLLVFGREEREKIELELPKLTPKVKAAYEAAATFHDGKWMALVVDSSATAADVEFLLKLKRKPGKALQATTVTRNS